MLGRRLDLAPRARYRSPQPPSALCPGGRSIVNRPGRNSEVNVAPTSSPDVNVVKAFAGAIVSFATLPDELAAKVAVVDQKFVVHPHVATVPSSDALLTGYLRQIYS